jgi:hypothetical protein
MHPKVASVSMWIVVHAVAPPAGLVETRALPAASTATQNDVDGHETARRSTAPPVSVSFCVVLLSICATVHAPGPPAGFPDVTALPAPSTATQSDAEAHEMLVRSLLPSTSADRQSAARPPAGFVDHRTDPLRSAATHSVVDGHAMPLIGTPATALGAVHSTGPGLLGTGRGVGAAVVVVVVVVVVVTVVVEVVVAGVVAVVVAGVVAGVVAVVVAAVVAVVVAAVVAVVVAAVVAVVVAAVALGADGATTASASASATRLSATTVGLMLARMVDRTASTSPSPASGKRCVDGGGRRAAAKSGQPRYPACRTGRRR